MKRTPVTRRDTSAIEPFRPTANTGLRRFAALSLVAGLSLALFFAGRVSVSDQHYRELQTLRLDIQVQQGLVDRLRRDNLEGVNALSARLAELQAASTRLDALGERLAQMGQLSLDEFDFSEPAPVGGPADYDALGPAGEFELRQGIAALSERLRRQSAQLDALQYLMMNRQLEQDLTPAGWPVSRGWISSRFGERSDPFTGEKTMHWGVDFSGTRGTDVKSVAGGVVVWAATRTDFGKTVEIDHGNGYLTRYAHNESLSVNPGDRVTAGQVIGKVGSSGRASGPHVHFEVLKDGNRINPAKFVGSLR